MVGSLDEEFAVESNAGDVFLLGNTSWRVKYVRGGDVTVTDAQGAPPTIPFWQGEGPGRSLELSEEVARLREDLEARLNDPAKAEAWLQNGNRLRCPCRRPGGDLCDGPESGDRIYSPRSRTWFTNASSMRPAGCSWSFMLRSGRRSIGLGASRCGSGFAGPYDFELQATADDDGFILSLGPQHSFPIESLFSMLTEANAQSPVGASRAGGSGVSNSLAMERDPLAVGDAEQQGQKESRPRCSGFARTIC